MLHIDAENALPSGSTAGEVQVVNGGTLDLGGYNVTVPSLVSNGATLDFDLSSTGTNTLTVSAVASVSGTNTINITPQESSLAVGTYDLITAASGLDGTFQFGNQQTLETVTVGGATYTLTLGNTSTAETVTVTAATATTTTVTGSPWHSAFGQAVTFTATVTPAAGTFDDGGTVQFQVDGTNYGQPVALNSSGQATLRDSALSAGTHAITATYSGETDFGGSSSATFNQSVAQASPTITWDTLADITYGTPLTATQLDASSSVPGTFTYSPALGTVLHAGTTRLSVSFTPADQTDYSGATAGVNLRVDPTGLTITADNRTMVYGGSLPALTASYSGFVNGDNAASLMTTPTLSTVPAAGSPVGTYPITASGAADPDYDITYAGGMLTVNPATPTVVSSAPADITYGTPLSTTQLDATAIIPGTFSYSRAVGAVLHAGTTQLSATFTPADQTDYSGATASVDLMVDPAALTVTADNQAMVYGASLPVLTASYNGFVNGDSAVSLTTPPTLSTTATAASSVGTYPISAGGAADPDYSISYVGSTLTVNPADVTVSGLVAENKTYDGTTAATLDFNGASLHGVLQRRQRERAA